MDRQEAIQLFEKYENGTMTEQERIKLDQWYHRELSAQRLSEEEANFFHLKDEIFNASRERAGMKKITTKKSFPKWPLFTTAASVLLVASLGIYFYTHNIKDKSMMAIEVAAHIKPGKNGATLTLSDGRQINIAEAKDGKLAEENGVSISKDKEGALVYKTDNTKTDTSKINTIDTHKGEQQLVVLPDGSKVWLNAASSLKYKSSIAAAQSRQVELFGEAYFEVKKDTARPFSIITKNQKVTVLGTHFNINGYLDMGEIMTTLLEGSVKVETDKQNTVIKPGDQAVLKADGILQVSPTNVADAIAWKNGEFVFRNEEMGSIMKKVERWYNVKIEFEKGAEKVKATGSMSKFSNLSVLLKVLGATGDLKFTAHNNTLKISK